MDIAAIARWSHDLLTRQVHLDAMAAEALGHGTQPTTIDEAQLIACIHPSDRPALAETWPTHHTHVQRLDEIEVRVRDVRHFRRCHWRLYRRLLRAQDGTPKAVQVVAIDITHPREQTQHALTMVRRLESIGRASRMGFWALRRGRRPAYWGPHLFEMHGLAADQPLPHPRRWLRDHVHPGDRAHVRRAFLAWRRSASLSHEVEFRLLRADGVVLHVVGHSRRDADDGERSQPYGLLMDITAQRVAQAAERRAAADKAAAERELAVKSRFLSRISHELRTPLNAVLGFTQLLQEKAADETEGAFRGEWLGQIRRAGHHLLALIDDVLDLSRVHGGELTLKLESVAMASLVETVLPLIEPMARDHQVRIRLGRLQVAARVDETRMRQVLLNLLSNAIKYNRPGGEVVLEAERVRNECRLRVRDTGIGLGAHQLRHLFEPFNRLGAEQTGVTGTGIGLAIAKALVERMGGRLVVESVPGVGSCFEIRLPTARAMAHADHPRATAAATEKRPGTAGAPTTAINAAAASMGGRILYIEDNPVNALIVAELVRRREGIELEIAENGREGLERARRRPPDLILLDMQLPDMTGRQVFDALQAEPATRDVPCIALSANAMPEDVQRALDAGFREYWIKPLDFGLFDRAIERMFSCDAEVARAIAAATPVPPPAPVVAPAAARPALR